MNFQYFYDLKVLVRDSVYGMFRLELPEGGGLPRADLLSVETLVKPGYKRNSDYNGADQEGVGYFQLTMKGGRRCSSAKAYLSDARGRPNLEIITDAQTEKVIINDGRALGVRIRRHGQMQTIAARAEVILSAGAIGSPQILMLSGIGAGDELSQHGINVVSDLQGVGKNLQDHLQARPVFKTTLSTINTETNNIFKQGLIAAQYALTQRGPMTMAASLGTLKNIIFIGKFAFIGAYLEKRKSN